MKYLLLAIVTVSSVSCSSVHKLPDEGQDIKQVYDNHISDISETRSNIKNYAGIARDINDGTIDLGPYTRNQNNELNNLFPLLPNPQLIMYVDPHLSKKGHPVPGYSVPFRLYEKDEYAMPGEIKQ